MGLTPGFQATMVPSSVTNMNTAPAEAGSPVLEKPLMVKPPVSVLNTVPEGVPTGFSGSRGVGILTTRGLMAIGAPFWPGVLYRVDTPALLSEIQNGLVSLSEMPQGLTRLGSVTAATPGRSDTRLVCRTVPCWAWLGACGSR